MNWSRVLSIVAFRLVMGCCLLAGLSCSLTAAETGLVSRVLEDDQGAHKYAVYLPANFDPARKWPVVLFLHGAGERGVDGLAQTRVGLGALLAERTDYPFVVVFPQCEDTRGRILEAWSAESPDGQRALKMLDATLREFNGDAERQVLTGWSMGAWGCWSLAAATPDRWSAVVPVSGGSPLTDYRSLVKLPLWAFHGATDVIVRPDEARTAIGRLTQVGGQPRLTVVPKAGHDVWKQVYSSDQLLEWMLAPSLGGSGSVAIETRPGERPAVAADPEAAFVPALEIPQAGYVRLGNQMLSALAYSVPARVPEDLLSGAINDIFDATVAQGRTFQVRFSRISYHGQVTRAHVEAYRQQRLNIQLGLENVQLRIGGTSVRGRSHSATTGPINIVIGHRRPVWLSIALEPYVENRRLRLRLIATRFEIPRDNWYVTRPAGISVSGFGMTRDKVSDGLVRGLYGSRQRIENEVKSVVPEMVAELEKNLEMTDVGDQVSLLWPLPVYRPRLRVWPQQVSVDDAGVSLVLGMTVAAVDPATAPESPASADPLPTSIDTVPRNKSLEVGVAGEILNPLTRLLIDADVARIHVADIPNGAFESFADRATLSKIIPELQTLGDDVEVWSELVLVEPIDIVDATPSAESPAPQADSADPQLSDSVEASTEKASTDNESTDQSSTDKAAPGQVDDVQSNDAEANEAPSQDDVQQPVPTLAFQAPSLAIAISVRKAGTEQWTPFVDARFRLFQAATLALDRPDFESRFLQLQWAGDPQVSVSAEFSPGYQPTRDAIDQAALQELFLQSWKRWTQGGPGAQTQLEDVAVGEARLRADDLGWTRQHLFARFDPPGIRISNQSEIPLVYEVQAGRSSWGGPYTIEPGEADTYSVSYPLTWRRRVGNRYQTYTLPIGSHSLFKVPKGGTDPDLFRAPRVTRTEASTEDASTESDSTQE